MIDSQTCWCMICFFFNDTATTEIYTLSLHDALPIFNIICSTARRSSSNISNKRNSSITTSSNSRNRNTSSRISRCIRRSEEHTSELQSRQYLVCRLLLEKKNTYHYNTLPLQTPFNAH